VLLAFVFDGPVLANNDVKATDGILRQSLEAGMERGLL
jgi:hypothetical protein